MVEANRDLSKAPVEEVRNGVSTTPEEILGECDDDSAVVVSVLHGSEVVWQSAPWPPGELEIIVEEVT